MTRQYFPGKKPYYTTNEVARLLDLTAKDVRSKAARGELRAVKLPRVGDGAKAHWRFPADEIDRLVTGVPAPTPALPTAADIARELCERLMQGEFEIAMVLRPLAASAGSPNRLQIPPPGGSPSAS